MPDKAEQLKQILELLKEDTVSEKQFIELTGQIVKSVQLAVDYCKNTTEDNRRLFDQSLKDLRSERDAALSELKKDSESRMNLLVDQVLAVLAKVQDGKDGRDGVDGLNGDNGKDGRDGKDGSPDTGQEIVDKINELPTDSDEAKIDASHIKNLPKTVDKQVHSAFVTRGQVLVKDLSASLDGVTKTFSMPAFDRIVMITSTSFPYTFRPTVDYTVSNTNMTITFTSEINEAATLASGQTLLVLYTTL